MLAACGGEGGSADPAASPPSTHVAIAEPARPSTTTTVAKVAPAKSLVSRETLPHVRRSQVPSRTGEGYRAIGTEPFWALTITGGSAQLERADKAPRRFRVERIAQNGAIRYLGDGFTVTLSEGPCSDGMSDALWSDRVQIAFADGTLKGCGGAREDMREGRS
jgi:uncharacterized membrane protein